MVEGVANQKVDWVKIRVDDNLGTAQKMTPEIYKAVIDEAHKRGLRVASHLYYLEDAKGLLSAGTDFIAHSVRDQRVDDEFVAALKASKRCYTPTLMREVSTWVYESTPDFFADTFFLQHANPARQLLLERLLVEIDAGVLGEEQASAIVEAAQHRKRDQRRSDRAHDFESGRDVDRNVRPGGGLS